MTTLIHDLTEHLKVYLLAGTLVAVGLDVTANVSGTMRGTPGGTMAEVLASHTMVSTPTELAVQAVGIVIALVGGTLYIANIWCGFVALRQFRFRFEERGFLLKSCGWSAAFVYVLTSAVIGLAVNAVYLALVR